MKSIFLYGANCTTIVWDELNLLMDNSDTLIIEYPHEITEKAETVKDVAQWVYDTYGGDLNCDCIIGHSMGGIIALDLITNFGISCQKVILIESNLKPAEKFYRNLMTPENMAKYGKKIIPMIKAEAPFYADKLKQSFQDDFDFTDLVLKSAIEIHGIYGDRSEQNYKDRISDLNLGRDIENNINFHFIKDCCHMPMVENPEALAEMLKDICQ